MKTLHLTNCRHASSGGIGTFYRALFEAVDREGHLMRLVVPGVTTSVEPVGRFGRIYHIEALRAPLNPDYRMVLPHRYLFPRTALQRILNEERPDLIEISDKYALPCFAGFLRTGRLPGVALRPTVVGMSHERMDENMAAYVTPGRAGRRFCEWFMKWLYFPMFDHHIAVSEHTAQELISASRGHKVRRGIWVAPMGVDYDLFTPDRGSAAGRRRLLDLVRGSGDSMVLLKDECAARDLRHVAFLCHVADRETLAEYYANADIFVHPNPREPFGIAPLEAMSSGLALVAPDSGGVLSYANASNAWLADATPAAFADSIAGVRADPAERAAKTAAARKTAEQHRWPEVTARYLQLFRELHVMTQGGQRTETIAARTWSTPGDLFGRELIGL